LTNFVFKIKNKIKQNCIIITHILFPNILLKLTTQRVQCHRLSFVLLK